MEGYLTIPQLAKKTPLRSFTREEVAKVRRALTRSPRVRC